MQKRIIGFIACALALVGSFGVMFFQQEDQDRYHQHLEAAEKQPCSHTDNELCTHLPLVQIDTAGKEIPGLPIYDENKKQLFIPPCFAHGFVVLSDHAEFAYKCDDVYNHSAEGGLKYDDPDVNIVWPMGDLKKEDLLTSEKDAKWPSLKELKELFETKFYEKVDNISYYKNWVMKFFGVNIS